MPALKSHLLAVGMLATPLMLAANAYAEPQPVEYVRICDPVGTGYFCIPGTETCLKISGYVRLDQYVDGLTEDYKVGVLAFEPTFGTLINPALTYDVGVDGEGFGAGLYSRFVSPTQKLRLKFELDYAHLSGSGGTMGTLPNVGVPSVGDGYGFAFKDPSEITTYYTDYDASTYIDVKQWGLKLQSHYRLSGDETPDMNAWATHTKVLGGLQYYNTQTDVETHADLDNYAGMTYVTYKTDLSENTFIPYVGLSTGYKMDLSGLDRTQLYLGASAKVGAAFTGYSGYDRLMSTGAVGVDREQRLDESVVTGYLALEGTVALKNGPFKVGLVGNLSYGQFRDPGLYREDSVEVAPDVWEPVPTAIKADPLFSGRISLQATYQFNYEEPDPYQGRLRLQRSF